MDWKKWLEEKQEESPMKVTKVALEGMDGWMEYIFDVDKTARLRIFQNIRFSYYVGY